MKKYIAERKLFYTNKGEFERKEFSIRIGYPYQAEQSKVNFTIGDSDVFGCSIEIIGIPEKEHDVYGVDSVQAINIASNIEPLLERLQKKYNIYWQDGEPYFDGEE